MLFVFLFLFIPTALGAFLGSTVNRSWLGAVIGLLCAIAAAYGLASLTEGA